ncbi:YeeE/YedE family protein [Rhodobacteraceae bacterium NNCM2]|nr:YeeE/YedE family protein [Coraliihabitans acroporae]
MPEILSEPLIAALIGFAGGVALGLAARMGRFCTLGAIEAALYAQDLSGIRMWALALAVAIAGSFTLAEAGLIDLGATMYSLIRFDPLASIAGGLLFGYGMAIAGNCGFGALARLGGGDLRSFVIVIVMGITAFMTIGGPLAYLRVALFPTEFAPPGAGASGYAHLIGARTGLGPLVPALIVALGFLAYALAEGAFRRSTRHLVWGTVAGLAILSGWVGTTWLAGASFAPVQVESHSFTAPLGETILYLMTASGGGLSFPVGSVCGVLAGSALGALWQGHFRWEACDDARELGRQIAGGALMGIGGVVALGCSIGQGLTAFSALAYSAPLVLGAIFIGASIGLRQLISGFDVAE